MHARRKFHKKQNQIIPRINPHKSPTEEQKKFREKVFYCLGLTSLAFCTFLSLIFFNYQQISDGYQSPHLASQERIQRTTKPTENPQKSNLFKASQLMNYEIVGKYPRAQQKTYFTQGLSFVNKTTLLESSGLYGQSYIHFLNDFDKPNRTITNQYKLVDQKLFGEGSDSVMTSRGLERFMLTWQNRKVLVFDEQIALKREIELPQPIKEGWGITHFENNGSTFLVVSDGSHRIFHVNPEDFSVIKSLEVKQDGKPLNLLNELEMYKSNILLANIWNTNKIAKINVLTGELIDIYVFQDLLNDIHSEDKYKGYVSPQTGNVLNGIAYDQENDRMIIGGKRWPYWYEIKIYE